MAPGNKISRQGNYKGERTMSKQQPASEKRYVLTRQNDLERLLRDGRLAAAAKDWASILSGILTRTSEPTAWGGAL
jgi:hypothetical protein